MRPTPPPSAFGGYDPNHTYIDKDQIVAITDGVEETNRIDEVDPDTGEALQTHLKDTEERGLEIGFAALGFLKRTETRTMREAARELGCTAQAIRNRMTIIAKAIHCEPYLQKAERRAAQSARLKRDWARAHADDELAVSYRLWCDAKAAGDRPAAAEAKRRYLAAADLIAKIPRASHRPTHWNAPSQKAPRRPAAKTAKRQPAKRKKRGAK